MKRTTFLCLFASLFVGFAHAADTSPVVVIKTNHGSIKVKLNAEKAPKTVENFLSYVKEDYYNNTVFHRVIKGFMIQGGGFAKKDDGKHEQKDVKAMVKNEASNGLKNAKGTIAMARTANPDSATSQFFISSADNTGKLDPGGVDPYGYTVFGEVVEGMDVVAKIEATPTKRQVLVAKQAGQKIEAPMGDVPVEAVVVESITVEKEAPKAEPKKEEPKKEGAPK
jgi:cyclophilin family peptidyl-prolyl cis-trans isomerase